MSAFQRFLYVIALAIAVVFFLWGCSKLPGFVGISFDLSEIHKMSANSMLLIAVFGLGVANLLRR